jgi:hypothetical protein
MFKVAISESGARLIANDNRGLLDMMKAAIPEIGIRTGKYFNNSFAIAHPGGNCKSATLGDEMPARSDLNFAGKIKIMQCYGGAADHQQFECQLNGVLQEGGGARTHLAISSEK